VLERLRTRTIERGEDSELPLVDAQLAMLERFLGRLDSSAGYAEEGYEQARQLGSPAMQTIMLAERCLTRTTAGDISGARADIAVAQELVKRTGYALGDLWCRCAIGWLELSVGNPAVAREAFEPMVRAAEARGSWDPITGAYLPDAIETLVATGELERAHTLAMLVNAYAETVGRHQVALARRTVALVLAARGDMDAALDRAAQAVDAFHQLPLPLGLARALLVKGQIHRRRREKLLAREALSQSEQIFGAVGAPLWAERARAELRRVGLRALAPDELTHTEQRIAALAAEGFRNQQIADRVFVSPKTVEANLARIYRKLGVRSRAELAARFHRQADLSET
jgi:DNA-binding CsgD family transcriptional regulator